MFCGCELSFGDEPNTRTCPVCLGLPGALPVLNAQAVHYGLLMGLAFDCEIAPRSIFHRKNYFYPDKPRTTRSPSTTSRSARAAALGDVRLHRIHLEEDAAKLVHLGESGPHPRLRRARSSTTTAAARRWREIVTEPDIHSAEQARDWLTLLRVTLRQLGVSDVNMEEGSLRCDANVSVRPAGSDRARHQDRAQEHELVPLPDAGHQRGDRAPDRAARGRRAGRARRRCTSTRASGRLTLAALQGGGARLPLLPGARPRAARADARRCSQAARAALPELPAERAERYERDWALPADTARLFAFEPELGRLLRGGRDRAATAPSRARSPTG